MTSRTTSTTTQLLSGSQATHVTSKEYLQAIEFFEATLKTQPDRYAWTGLGFALLQLGRYEEAVASYDQALALRSADETSWCNRGHALYRLGRYPEALASYSQALKLEPDFDAAFYGKARVYAVSGYSQLAIEHLCRAIALSPEEYSHIAANDPCLRHLWQTNALKLEAS